MYNKIVSIGANSSGNCHFIVDEEKKSMVILDLGTDFQSIQKAIRKLGYGQYERTVFISHHHLDHNKSLLKFQKSFPSQIVAPYKKEITKGKIITYEKFKTTKKYDYVKFHHSNQYYVGKPIDNYFLIYDKIVYLTDIGNNSKYLPFI